MSVIAVYDIYQSATGLLILVLLLRTGRQYTGPLSWEVESGR